MGNNKESVSEDIQNVIVQLTDNLKELEKKVDYNIYLSGCLTKNMSRLLSIANIHKETFSKFKNKYKGKKIVLVGAGPSLNDFKGIKDNDAIFIGLNRAFQKKDIKFDYLFAIDVKGIDFCIKDFFEYDCIKFVGDQNNGKDWQIPENYLCQSDILRYKTTAGFMENCFALELDTQPLGNFLSVALQAIQFALYTNPDEIYLVGIDCTGGSGGGHFTANEKTFNPKDRGENTSANDEITINNWKELKEFVSIYYPKTEIISINPVGLKGIFKDLYQ